MSKPLAEFLKSRLAGFSQQEIADKVGLNQGTVSRILRGGPPSIENCLRLSLLTGTHPGLILDMGGYREMAFVLKELFPMTPGVARHEYDASYSPWATDLHRRLELLVLRGRGKLAALALEEAERYWRSQQPVFEALAKQAGAKAAALVADSHALQGDVLYRWRCDEVTARGLAAKRRARGWVSQELDLGWIRLTLFLKRSKSRSDEASIAKGLRLLALGARLDAPPGAPKSGPQQMSWRLKLESSG